MSEKRFKLIKIDDYVFQIHDIDNDLYLVAEQICDLLNELSTSCRQLETEVKTQKDYLMNKGLTEDYSEWKKME